MDIFKNNTSTVPKSDAQIIRVDMEEQQIGGRKSRLPEGMKPEHMSVKHIPNAG